MYYPRREKEGRLGTKRHPGAKIMTYASFKEFYMKIHGLEKADVDKGLERVLKKLWTMSQPTIEEIVLMAKAIEVKKNVR